MKKPVAIDLCCGLGGWAEGLLAEGYDVIGYDTEAHDYGTGGYPGTLILQDITTLHGSQFKDVTLFVASPPCQRYSYMAMPWSRAKAQAAMIEADTTGEELRKLNLLFDTCFRLQREASEAAGHHIPMIVENVRGAQRWVGRAKWHYGSYFLWGDVPALMPMTFKATKVPAFRFDGSGKSFQTASVEHTKAAGKNWNEWKDWDGTEENKPPSVRPWGDELKIGNASARTFAERSLRSADNPELDPHNFYHGALPEGTKQGGDWFGANCESSMSRLYGSKSPKRKEASAMIAKIPYPLAQHIARSYYPQEAV